MDKRYSIEEVFEMIGETHLNKNNDHDKNQFDIEVDGFKVHPVSLRYMTFYQKGTECVCCGKKGAYFQLDQDRNGNGSETRRHFNLYAEDGTLMTKDHIIPKSKGGRDVVTNMQPMCVHCNKAKGATCEGYEKEYIVGTDKNGKQICFTTIEKAAYHMATIRLHLGAKKVPKEEAIKGAISCVFNLHHAINKNQNYGGYTWKKEIR